MIQALNAAITGLKAATTRTRVASNNIANLTTDNFKRSVTVQTEVASGGTAASVQKDMTPGDPFPENKDTNIPAGEYSNVDLPTELVELIRSKHALTANIKVIQTANEILGEMVNIKA